MKKNFRLLLCFWCLILSFSGCTYKIDHEKTKVINDIEKIKSIKEIGISTEIKTEYLKQFEKYAGFSLPEYFILPESKGNCTTMVEETGFLVITHFFMNKKDALEILNKIKKDNKWNGYRYWSEAHKDPVKNIEKDKGKCSYFIKKLSHRIFIELNFHYNKNNDNYIISLYSLFDRANSGDNQDIIA